MIEVSIEGIDSGVRVEAMGKGGYLPSEREFTAEECATFEVEKVREGRHDPLQSGRVDVLTDPDGVSIGAVGEGDAASDRVDMGVGVTQIGEKGANRS